MAMMVDPFVPAVLVVLADFMFAVTAAVVSWTVGKSFCCCCCRYRCCCFFRAALVSFIGLFPFLFFLFASLCLARNALPLVKRNSLAKPLRSRWVCRIVVVWSEGGLVVGVVDGAASSVEGVVVVVLSGVGGMVATEGMYIPAFWGTVAKSVTLKESLESLEGVDCGVAGEGVVGAGPRDLSKGPMDLPPKKGDEGNRGLSKSELVDMFEKFVQKMPTGVSFFYVEFCYVKNTIEMGLGRKTGRVRGRKVENLAKSGLKSGLLDMLDSSNLQG